MFLQLLMTLVAASTLGVAVLFVNQIVKTTAAREDFERRGRGLRITDKFSVWAGHINSYFFVEGQMHHLDKWRKKFNNAKTVGWLFGHSKCALSVDLHLIKRVVLDQQEDDRISLHLPLKEIEQDCILTAKTEQWRGIRRALAPALRPNKFKSPNVQREIDGSIDKLIRAVESKLNAAESGEIELDIDDYAHRFQLDLLFNCFYKQDNLVDFEAAEDPMVRVTESGYEAFMWSPFIRMCTIFPALGPIIDWLIMNFHPQGVWRKKMLNFIKLQTKLNFEARRQLEQMKESGKSVADEDSFLLGDGTKFNRNMIDHVIDQFYEGKLTRAEYFHSTFFLVSAADKTGSDAIAHTIYQVALHSDVQEKLRTSILAEGEDSEYLAWVINESLRILPPVAVGCSRLTSRDYECEDGVVPSGTFLTPAAYSVHRLTQYWGDDVELFRPERFANAKNFHPLQFIAFGAGARNCPGKEFALHEMKRVICALLTRYKFQCEPLDLKYCSPFFMLQLANKHIHAKVSRLA